MKVTFLWIGKSKDKSFLKINTNYIDRLSHYSKCEIKELKDAKGKKDSSHQIKIEADLIKSHLKVDDYVVLLDEKGKHYTSRELALFLQHKMNISIRNLVFIIAGAYGADKTLKDRADQMMSLSHFTLTHDMARMVILEQIYRAFTILKGEKYHND